jgi:hypothetical protein
MRRAQISFAAMWAGESAFMVALGVVAYREGGVGAWAGHRRAHGVRGTARPVPRDAGRPGPP